jgi:acetyl esterase
VNELDPQVRDLLEQMRARRAQRPALGHSLSPDEKIAATRASIAGNAPLRFPSETVSRVNDFDIPGTAGTIRARLYVPNAEEPLPSPMPALVYYHGGGFVAGDLASCDTLIRAVVNRARCIAVSVAYRLAPENPYPAANDDAWSALMWVAEHGAEIGADARRLAVGGDSSGGLLAAWVAKRAKSDGPALRLQVLLNPTLDPTTSSASWRELGTGEYVLSRGQMTEWYDAYLPVGIDRTDPRVSPLFATQLAGIAPALIITADHDPLHDEGDAYAAKLKAANVAVNHMCWSGMIHGLPSLGGVLDAGAVLIDQIGTALREAFEQLAKRQVVRELEG